MHVELAPICTSSPIRGRPRSECRISGQGPRFPANTHTHTHILVRGRSNRGYECLLKVTGHIQLFASEKYVFLLILINLLIQMKINQI